MLHFSLIGIGPTSVESFPFKFWVVLRKSIRMSFTVRNISGVLVVSLLFEEQCPSLVGLSYTETIMMSSGERRWKDSGNIARSSLTEVITVPWSIILPLAK
jgi:hypothetical protein